MDQKLAKITTEWTKIEGIREKEGAAALASFLTARYFEPIAKQLRKMKSKADDLEIYELASDVIYEFIKNEYRMIDKLEREKRPLRGLFFRIIKIKLGTPPPSYETWEDFDKKSKDEDSLTSMCLDLYASLDKLKEERPNLYEPFVHHYFENRSLAETGELMGIKTNAVKQRLYNARQWLAKCLDGYQTE